MARRKRETSAVVARRPREHYQAAGALGGAAKKARYTVDEVKRQVDFIEGLLVNGATTHQVMALASQPPPKGLGVSKSRARRLVQRIQARWEDEDRARSSSRRSEQARRLLRQIQACQGRRDPNNPNAWIEKPNHHAIARYEALLAKILGTEAPIEVDVNVHVTESMAAVFARYSVDRLKELHARAEAKRRLAAAYLREHPEERAVIDVEGKVSE